VIDWDDDQPAAAEPEKPEPAKAAAEAPAPAPAPVPEPGNEAAEPTAVAAPVAASGGDSATTKPPQGEEAAAAVTTADPEAPPKETLSQHLAPTDVDKEAEKRAKRAARFGIVEEQKDGGGGGGDKVPAAKLAERAARFGTSAAADASSAIASSLDSALPDRPARKRGLAEGLAELKRPPVFPGTAGTST